MECNQVARIRVNRWAMLRTYNNFHTVLCSWGRKADYLPTSLLYTDKKEKKIFLIYKEIQSGAVAKSNMRKDFLIYEKMRKFFPIYEEAVRHLWLCNCSILNFLIYEENLIFFFLSVYPVHLFVDVLVDHADSKNKLAMLNTSKRICKTKFCPHIFEKNLKSRNISYEAKKKLHVFQFTFGYIRQ